MTNLREKTAACTAYLKSISPEGLRDPAVTQCRIFRDWLSAVYADPSFLDPENFFSCYEECRNKPAEEMSSDEVRACITFYVRQMRFQYPPYPCIVDGELLGLLDRWLRITEEEEA